MDRAALDVALALGLPCGGFCPRGRKAEDGRIPQRYPLIELDSPHYADRTEANVRAADATLILSPQPLQGGTQLTAALCEVLGKPVLVVDPTSADGATVRQWLTHLRPAVLNVAGPRESQCPGIYQAAFRLLHEVFSSLA